MPTLTATTVSSRAAMPVGAQAVRVFNNGPMGVYVALGDATVEARPTGNLVFANSFDVRQVGTELTHFAAVTLAGSATVDIDRYTAGGAGGSVTISDIEPPDAESGSWWFKWDEPGLYLRYDHLTWNKIAPTMDTPVGPPAPPPGPPAAGAPVVSSSLAVDAVENAAFSYQITASNSPTSYDATGLPGWLSVNTTTGVISGTAPAAPDTASFEISATNALGTGTATLVVSVIVLPAGSSLVDIGGFAARPATGAENGSLYMSNDTNDLFFWLGLGMDSWLNSMGE